MHIETNSFVNGKGNLTYVLGGAEHVDETTITSQSGELPILENKTIQGNEYQDTVTQSYTLTVSYPNNITSEQEQGGLFNGYVYFTPGTGNTNYEVVSQEGIKLPDEYQRVEYIESTGTQYIDTQLNLKSDDFKINAKFVRNESTSEEQAIFSIWTSSFNYWNAYIKSNNHFVIYTAGNNEFNYTITNNVKCIVSLQRIKSEWEATINDNSLRWTYSNSSINGTTLKIFTRGDVPQIANSNTHISLYRLDVTVNGSLVRNLIPCYRISDNVIGMYDLANDVFYTNAGSGTFLKGPNIN